MKSFKLISSYLYKILIGHHYYQDANDYDDDDDDYSDKSGYRGDNYNNIDTRNSIFNAINSVSNVMLVSSILLIRRRNVDFVSIKSA